MPRITVTPYYGLGMSLESMKVERDISNDLPPIVIGEVVVEAIKHAQRIHIDITKYPFLLIITFSDGVKHTPQMFSHT